MRRLALPLALSLLGHAALVALVLCCSGGGAPPSFGDDDGPSMRLSLGSPSRPKPAPPRPLEQEWPVDIAPRIVPANAVGEAAAPVVAVSHAGGPESPGGAGAAVGFAPAPVGSSLLPITKRAHKVVYLLDRSMSMGQRGALDRAVLELKLSLRALPPDTLFQVFAYNKQVTALTPAPAGLARAEGGLVALTCGSLDDLAPTGTTDHAAALRRALKLQPDLVFLLTDADDLTDKQVRAITHENRSGSVLHVVELTLASGKPDGPLSRLAALNGGSHRRARP